MRTRLVAAFGLALLAAVVVPHAAAQDPPPGLPPGLPPGFGPPPGGTKPAKPADDALPAKEVTLQTDDKVQIAATFHATKEKGGAGVVLLHGFGDDRKAWDAVLKPLAARGVAVLAIDLRGHGGSAKQGKTDLAPRVQKRDPKLFAEMHRDAAAAVAWLVMDGGCDPKRIALVGAGLGASVAIDAARRHPADAAAVACLSPSATTVGLDAVAFLRTFPEKTPLLVVAHRTDVDLGAQKVADARPGARLVVWDDAAPADAASDKHWALGTKMLGRLPLADLAVASFVAARTGSEKDDVVLDGDVEEGDGADPWDRAVDVARPGSDGTARAFRVGRRIVFGGTAPADMGGMRFEVQSGKPSEDSSAPFPILGPPAVVCVDLQKGAPAWKWGGMGSAPSFGGMPRMFGQTWPVLRVLRAGDRLTFEGEWFVPAFSDPDAEKMSLVVVFDREVHPGPNDGTMDANPQHAVDLPSR